MRKKYISPATIAYGISARTLLSGSLEVQNDGTTVKGNTGGKTYDGSDWGSRRRGGWDDGDEDDDF